MASSAPDRGRRGGLDFILSDPGALFGSGRAVGSRGNGSAARRSAHRGNSGGRLIMRNRIALSCIVLMCAAAWADGPADASSAPERSDRSPAAAAPVAVDPINLGDVAVTGTL